MKVYEVLDRAVELVEGGWLQGNFAKDQDGNLVRPNSAYACSFCAQGALARASEELGGVTCGPISSKYSSPMASLTANVYRKSKMVLAEILNYESEYSLNLGDPDAIIQSWNDNAGTTKQDVIRVLKKTRTFAAQRGL